MEFITTFIYFLAQALTIAIFARAILSWFPNVSNDNPLVALVYQVTEPILAPLRSVIPLVGMIDITPLVAIITLQLIANIVSRV
ncbi:MAG: YggT family protein [Dehalococcoidia bacterium]|nr:YggT family protein [Dehalococcoidia bacterium]